MDQPNIKAVCAGPGRTLAVTWKDGTGHTVDLAAFLDRFAVFESLLTDAAAFQVITVGEWGWNVHWTDDQEIAADTLWRLALEQDAAHFRAWRAGWDLTQPQAAEALGLSPRMVKYYESGTHPLPKTVRLAMVGYAALRQAA